MWTKQATPTDRNLLILHGSDIIDMAVGGPDGEVIYAIVLQFARETAARVMPLGTPSMTRGPR